jgi:hypothetical protein
MAITVTKLSGPAVIPGGTGVRYDFSLLLDSAHASGGEAIDLTSYFSYIHSATINSVDAAADQVYKFGVVIPSAGTAVAADNVLITAHYSNADEGAMVEVTGDLSTVGELTITVVGKAYVDTSW